jgi:hypothetical protein
MVRYLGVCVPCDEQKLGPCNHCKQDPCANQKVPGKSLCKSCIKERRESRPLDIGKKQSRGTPTTYPRICTTCKSKDQALTECECCKKTGCTNKNKKEGRNICQECVKKEDHSISYGKKQQWVIFSGRRNDHLCEAKSLLGAIVPRGHSIHFVNNQNELRKDSFPAHQYEPTQFYNKQLLDKMTQSGVDNGENTKIKELGDGGMGASLKDCLPMDDVLKDIASVGEKMIFDGLGVSECKFGAAIFHLQDLEEAKMKCTTVYPGHRDKAGVGDHVMFHQVEGVSFTFIAVGGKEGDAQFDKASQGYDGYAEWKAFSGNEGSVMVTKFETELMKEAKAFQTTRVEVYQLRAGQSLCFAAAVSYHCSIIPPQVNETRRALLVFHGLERVFTGVASNKPEHQPVMTELVTEEGAVAVLTGLKRAETEPTMKTRKKGQAEPVTTIKKCLLLGMAYTKTDLPKLQGSEEKPVKMNDVAELVTRSLLGSQDGRDLWRILAVEENYPHYEVYTVARPETGDKQEQYSKTRHFGHNWNSHTLCRELKKSGHIFDHICMDYFWIQQGWERTAITESFITATILGFATEHVIQAGCMVVLPFTPHMLRLVLGCQEQIKQHYDIEYRDRDNTSDLVLYNRTCELDKKKMLHVFEKDMDAQAKYVSHSAKSVEEHLHQIGKGPMAKTFLQRVAKEDPARSVDSIMFIVLKRQKENIPLNQNFRSKRKRSGHK